MALNTDEDTLFRATHPVGASGIKRQLLASDTACAASGAWTYTAIVSPKDGMWRRMRLILELDAQAIGNIVALLPLVSFSEDAPASGADDWFMLGTTDGTVTATTMTGTVATGADYTLTPGQLVATAKGLVLSNAAATATTDEIRMVFPAIDITGVRHIQIAYAESVSGITATPSKIGLWYALSV